MARDHEVGGRKPRISCLHSWQTDQDIPGQPSEAQGYQAIPATTIAMEKASPDRSARSEVPSARFMDSWTDIVGIAAACVSMRLSAVSNSHKAFQYRSAPRPRGIDKHTDDIIRYCIAVYAWIRLHKPHSTHAGLLVSEVWKKRGERRGIVSVGRGNGG